MQVNIPYMDPMGYEYNGCRWTRPSRCCHQVVARCNVRVSGGAFGEEARIGMGNPKMVLMCIVQLLRMQIISQNDVNLM